LEFALSVVACTKSTIAYFAAPSFHEGSGSVAEAASARVETGKKDADRIASTTKVAKLWTSKLRAFRNRVLAIPSRVKDLSARQRASLTQELRAALTELADGR
jgi:hypothetical protein